MDNIRYPSAIPPFSLDESAPVHFFDRPHDTFLARKMFVDAVINGAGHGMPLGYSVLGHSRIGVFPLLPSVARVAVEVPIAPTEILKVMS